MAKSSKVRPHSGSRHFRPTSFPIPPCPVKVLGSRKKRQSRTVKKERKELEHTICSVCLEFPHNSVLLLCSSYDKGCRPYMCAASYRYSNCFEQYKKTYLSSGMSNEKQEGMEPLCPFCRGEVKGWTVVEDTQKYLNSKKRTCMHDGCALVGNYKGLSNHVKEDHPLARPQNADPALEEKWKRLELERERQDGMSSINSMMPGAVVRGDYVIEGSFSRIFTDINLDGGVFDAPFQVDSYRSFRVLQGFRRPLDFGHRTLPVPLRRRGRAEEQQSSERITTIYSKFRRGKNGWGRSRVSFLHFTSRGALPPWGPLVDWFS